MLSNRMHSALFFVNLPDNIHQQEWFGFLNDVKLKLQNEKNAKRLAENVWLVNFQNSPAALSWLVSFAERHGFHYGILQLDAEPQWLPAGFDPTSILGRDESS